MVNRILRDDPTKGDMHNRYPIVSGTWFCLDWDWNRQAITLHLLWQALKDYDMWPVYLLGLTWNMPAAPATNYLSLILRSADFSTFETTLLTIPAYALFLVQLIFWTWVSEKTDNRFVIVLFSQIWMLPLLIMMEVLPAGRAYVWARYSLNVLLIGYPYAHAILGKRISVFNQPFDAESVYWPTKLQSRAATLDPFEPELSDLHCIICLYKQQRSFLPTYGSSKPPCLLSLWSPPNTLSLRYTVNPMHPSIAGAI